MVKGKKYSEWSDAEKAEYKAKKAEYYAKREATAVERFAKLEAELAALNVKPEVMELFKQCKVSAGLEKGAHTGTYNGETYMQRIFGTDAPQPNTTVTYAQIGIRNEKGERMLPGENMKTFMLRSEDIVYKYDAKSIKDMVWHLNRREHVVKIDAAKCTVTYVGQKKAELEKPEPKKPAELIKNGGK